jgi:hypothetical protein
MAGTSIVPYSPDTSAGSVFDPSAVGQGTGAGVGQGPGGGTGTTLAGTGSATAAGGVIDPNTGAPLFNPTLYDPRNPVPYQPGAMPNVVQPIGNPLGQEQPVRDLGAVSHSGAAAYLGDQLLRGYMQGKAVAQARSALQLQQQQAGVGKLVDSASQRYLQLVQSGADPAEIQDAKQQVDAAWQAQTDLWKNHVQGLKLDKDGNLQPNKQNLLQRLTNPSSPNDIAPAAYEAMTKFGPPVYHQAAPYLTPQYQQQVQTARQQAGTALQTAGVTAQTQQQQAQNQLRIQQLIAKSGQSGGLTPEESDELTSLQTGIAAGGKGGAAAAILNFKPVPNSVPVLGPDGRYTQSMINERGVTKDMPLPPGFVPSAAALKGTQRFEMRNGLWESYEVNGQGQEITGTRKPLSAAAMNPGMTTTTTGQHIDPATGQVYNLSSTSTRRPNVPGEAGAGGGGGVPSGGGGGSAAPVTGPNSTPLVTPGYMKPALSKAQTQLGTDSRVASIAQDAVTNPSGSKDYLLLSSLLHSSVGRVNMQEINSILGSAGWGASADTWLSRARNGELSPQLRQQLAGVAQANQKASAQELNQLVQQAHQATQRGGTTSTGGSASPAGGWTPPAGAPDAKQYADGYVLRRKGTQQPVAIARGGVWQQP